MMSAASAQIIDFEDFGTGSYPGGALTAGQTTYNYNAPLQPANFPDILEDGDYVLATDTQQGFTSWSSIGDNTTGTGYMMLINADENQSGEFYRRQVTLTANTTFDFLTYLVTVNSQGDFDYCTNNEGGLILPNVTLQIEDNTGTVLASFDTGDIPFNPIPAWDEYKLIFTTSPATTSVDVILINNSVGGCGNDLAIDDITFRVAVTMEAFDDSITVTDTTTTQPAVLTLGDNDTLVGGPLPGTELYAVATGSTLPAGITLNGSTGEVSVSAGTPEGTYVFDYEVCETVSGFNCDTATATVIVDFPPLVVTAASDGGSVVDSSTGFTSVLNVLGNDSIDDVSPPAAFDLSVSSGSSVPAGLTFNTATGLVGVLQGTATGVYTFDYVICEVGDPSNCETATVTINVTNLAGPSVCPAGTTVTTGTFHVVSATSSGQPNPNFSVGAPLAEGSTDFGANAAVTYYGPITMDLTGDANVSVPAGEVIEVVLTSAYNTSSRAEILMSPDGVTYTSLGTTGNGGSIYGTWTDNVLRYDDFTVPVGGARFLQVLQQTGGMRADGVIYGNQCQAVPTTVTAQNESVSVAQSATEQSAVLTVIDNDTFDGVTPTTFDLTVNSGSALPSELTFDLTTGEIGVVAGTVVGVYSFDYDLCEAGTTNCDTATSTVTVTAPPTTTLSASKSVKMYDPLSLGLYSIPGNDVIYTIVIENTGASAVDAGTLVLMDAMPGEIEFYNADIDDAAGPETNPVAFVDGGSGLTFMYNSDVAFADTATKPANFAGCDYTPTPMSYDSAVNFICFNPKGPMAAASTWSVKFRARIK